MALVQKDLFNSPYAGVCATNDNLTLVPTGIPEDDMKAMSEALGTELEIITLGGSRVLGTLIAMNNNGIFLVSNIVTDLELEKFADISKNHKIDFGVLPDRSNAIGNNFLVNDRGGFSNERLGKGEQKIRLKKS